MNIPINLEKCALYRKYKITKKPINEAPNDILDELNRTPQNDINVIAIYIY